MAGVDAHYAFVGGDNLERRLQGVEWAHPILERHTALSVPRSIRSLRALIRRLGIDIIHSHLSHDHILALMARPRGTTLVRTFHNARALRADPLTQAMMRRTAGVCAVNHALAEHPLLRGRDVLVTPPPLDTRQFGPAGPTARATVGVPEDALLVGYIGKVAPRRGFEEAIETFAAIRNRRADAHLMIIGRGPHRAALEKHIASLGLRDCVIWAGYQDSELAAHYRAADLMLFTAPGSDHGHRAVIEEIGCGTPAVCYPVAGLPELLGPLASTLIADEATPDSVARQSVLVAEGPDLTDSLVARSLEFDYPHSSDRLRQLYQRLS